MLLESFYKFAGPHICWLTSNQPQSPGTVKKKHRPRVVSFLTCRSCSLRSGGSGMFTPLQGSPRMVALPSMDLKGQTMRYSLAIKRCNQTSIHGQFSLATFDCRKVYYGIFRCIDENSIKYILMRFIHQPEKTYTYTTIWSFHVAMIWKP